VAGVVVVLACAASAHAASSYTLCSSGPGKPVVSPGGSGKCAAGQKPIRLASVAALRSLQVQVNALKATLAGVSRAGHTLRFVGMNLQLEDGRGSTSLVNGLGNLIIGYNAGAGKQTGSHNLVLGAGQSFTSWGGIVGGAYNNLSGAASVVFGAHNTAAGGVTSVTGGAYNLATDSYASVTGGCDNLAGFGAPLNGPPCGSSGSESVTGGNDNTASGDGSSVSGGYANSALAPDASVLGGVANMLNTHCGTFPDGGESCP
jgi:hypothetical protein